ncbi:MAG: electron transfer flavoprotein subunit alpha/FixB family protein [Ignavibacteria bacterium]|jgi:electron transfer flavoprotein alpha subunit|nr:electron transfer flavoprotein subunit alpha/FixB family protein [Ignavibacteria bacterium]MCU7505055.1 electron transfer flavoprotein subunit alpha/FixB family protein [Ignavibacteria bacterium]MCU7515305.1 electron transfer flavoprotein subunit alpha/FixB family protein [Ignavibacteria bacterium]
MANKILTFLEQRNGILKKSSLETAKEAARLAGELSYEVEAVAIGSNIEDLESLGKYGIGKVTFFKGENLANYSSSAYAGIVSNYAQKADADILLFSNSAMGKDLAPLVCVKLNAGILMDCISLEVSSGDIVATRPVFAGKALVEARINSQKKIFTLRPNVFNIGSLGDNKAAVTVENVENPDLRTKVVEVKKSEGKMDVAEAEIIVSGGRGLKAPENFRMVEELADTLGAAVGASRAVVDAGWRPHSEQVGQTGKTVSPNLYIAIGISGAIQHLAGMSSSKYIVAINKDKDAPIFGVADYGIAGDIFEVLPALTEEIKKIKG